MRLYTPVIPTFSMMNIYYFINGKQVVSACFYKDPEEMNDSCGCFVQFILIWFTKHSNGRCHHKHHSKKRQMDFYSALTFFLTIQLILCKSVDCCWITGLNFSLSCWTPKAFKLVMCIHHISISLLSKVVFR